MQSDTRPLQLVLTSGPICISTRVFAHALLCPCSLYNPMPARRLPSACRLLPLMLEALLDVFRPAATIAAAQHAKQPFAAAAADPGLHAAPHPHPSHDAILAFLCSTSTALQQRVLRFAAALLAPSQHGMRGSGLSADQLAAANVAALRAVGLWRLAFGPAFFFWGGGADGQQQEEEGEEVVVGSLAVTATEQQADQARQQQHHHQQLAQLRQQLLGLVGAAATLACLPENEPEVGTLISVLEQAEGGTACTAAAGAAAHQAGAAVVPPVCVCLEIMLEKAPATTAAAMGACDLLGALTRLLTRTQRALAASMGTTATDAGDNDNGGEEEHSAASGRAGGPGEAAAAALRSARYAALSLLGAYLSTDTPAQLRAVQAWDSVSVLFTAVWEGDEATRRLALDMVGGAGGWVGVREDGGGGWCG